MLSGKPSILAASFSLTSGRSHNSLTDTSFTFMIRRYTASRWLAMVFGRSAERFNAAVNRIEMSCVWALREGYFECGKEYSRLRKRDNRSAETCDFCVFFPFVKLKMNFASGSQSSAPHSFMESWRAELR